MAKYVEMFLNRQLETRNCIKLVMIMELELATYKNLIIKSTVFPHRNIHDFTWPSYVKTQSD
jgi:hypothetical protein